MPDAYGSAAFVARVIEHAGTHGVRRDELLEAVGLPPDALDQPDALIPVVKGFALYEQAASRLGDPTMGLAVAQDAGVRTYGIIGFVLANHATLRAGFEDMVRLSNAMVPVFQFEMVPDDGHTAITLRMSERYPGHHLFVQEILAGMVLRAADLTGAPVHPVAVRLTSPPLDPAPFEAIFGVTPTFEAPTDALVLPDVELDRRVEGADPTLLTHLHEAAQTQIARRRAAQETSASFLPLRDCQVDLERGEVHRDGDVVPLTEREQQVLAYFAARPNQLVTHEALERDVWDIDVATLSHAPAVAIRRLRQKLERDPGTPVNLVTVFGEGWRLSVPTS